MRSLMASTIALQLSRLLLCKFVSLSLSLYKYDNMYVSLLSLSINMIICVYLFSLSLTLPFMHSVRLEAGVQSQAQVLEGGILGYRLYWKGGISEALHIKGPGRESI